MYLSVLSVFILLDTMCLQCLKHPEEGGYPLGLELQLA